MLGFELCARLSSRSLSKSFPCSREQECSASSAGFAGAICSGGGFGRGAEPPSELPSAPMEGVVASVAYAAGKRVGDVAIPDISEVLKRPGVFVWIGLHDPSSELLRQIQQEFGLHDLAIEDAQVAHQRPKLEQYGDSVFVVLRPTLLSSDQQHIELGETHIFVGPRYIVSVRHGATPSYTAVRARCDSTPALLAKE